MNKLRQLFSRHSSNHPDQLFYEAGDTLDSFDDRDTVTRQAYHLFYIRQARTDSRPFDKESEARGKNTMKTIEKWVHDDRQLARGVSWGQQYPMIARMKRTGLHE